MENIFLMYVVFFCMQFDHDIVMSYNIKTNFEINNIKLKVKSWPIILLYFNDYP